MRLEVIYFYYELAGLALREKRMHDLLVGNAINYSLGFVKGKHIFGVK